MASVLTLRELIHRADAYMSSGNLHLASEQNLAFKCAVKNSLSAGLNAQGLLRDSLSMLEELQRIVKQIAERWAAIALRVVGIMCLVVVARVFILHDVKEDMFQSWIFLDRICGCSAMAAMLLFACWVWQRYNKSSWNHAQDKKLQLWFADYLLLRDLEGQVPELSKSLRESRLAEITNGVDGQAVRKRLYLRHLAHHTDGFKRSLPQLAYVSILIEWGAFFCAALGFVLIPLLAWIDSASGV